MSPQSSLDGIQLASKLSYSHFDELVDLDEPTKRAFYELECIKGNWSVRGAQAPDRKPVLRALGAFARQGQTVRAGPPRRRHPKRPEHPRSLRLQIPGAQTRPSALLLCTHKNHALAEYALCGMDNQLFISKYQLELPPKEQMQAFMDAQLKALGEAR